MSMSRIAALALILIGVRQQIARQLLQRDGAMAAQELDDVLAPLVRQQGGFGEVQGGFQGRAVKRA